MPKVVLELDVNVYVLAAMCNSSEQPNHCPTEYGFRCPFYPEIAGCNEITPNDWRAICLAQEKEDGEA